MGLRAILAGCLCATLGCGESAAEDESGIANDPCRPSRELCADLNIAIFTLCGRTQDFVDPLVEGCLENFSCEMLEPLTACQSQAQALTDCICDTAGANGQCLETGAAYGDCMGTGWSCTTDTAVGCNCSRVVGSTGGTCDPASPFPCCYVNVSGNECGCGPPDQCDGLGPRWLPVASCPPP